MANIAVTYKFLNGSEVASLSTQNFLDIINGLTDGTKDLNVNSLTAATATLPSSVVIQNGNTLGATLTIGTNDAQSFGFETNNATRITIDSSGRIGIGTAPDSTIAIFHDNTASSTAVGTTQTGINFKFIPATGGTTLVQGGILQIGTTANTAHTKRVCLELFNRSKASGATLTTDIVLLADTTAQGTNNYTISDVGSPGTTGSFFLYSESTNPSLISGDLKINTAGKGLLVKEGSNAKMGVATLSSGTATVSTTVVTANSRIMVAGQDGSLNIGAVWVSARTAGTSFVISSTNALDAQNVAWIIFEPA